MSLILSGSDGVSDIDGTVSTPAIRGTDSNTGIFFPAADTIAFTEGGVESMRIDSAGLVGIGCTPVSNLQINASSDTGVAMSNSSSVTSGNRGTISMFNSSTSTVGYIRFGAVTDNVGTDIQFANRPAGGSLTERMRITSAGELLVGSTSLSGARVMISAPAAGGRTLYLNKGTGDTTDYFIVADTTTQNRFLVFGTGDVQNTNNSYGGISDVKLKENIVDATSKLEDLCKVKVRNYNLIGDTQKQIGVVAQELEQVFAGLVQETKDTDKEGNDLGTTTKAVKYSVFVPMLIKAIQELNAKVEAQAVEIATLKGN